MYKLFDDRRDFLYDMVVFYGTSTSRRSMTRSFATSPQGTYRHPLGNKCPVGRYMFPKKDIINLRGSLHSLTIYDPITNREKSVELTDYIPAKILALGVDFLNAVSLLHDSDACWNRETGLSRYGQDYFNKIITTYCSAEIHIDYEKEYIHRDRLNY